MSPKIGHKDLPCAIAVGRPIILSIRISDWTYMFNVVKKFWD